MSSASSSSAPQPDSKPSGAPKPMDFSGTDPSLTDGVVLVAGQKFHISKTHLARHSMFFETMFFEKGFQEANQKIVELKEVSAEGFQIFLELINGYNRLSDKNIESAIQCSSMWQSEIPLKKCTKFLQKKSKFSITEKFLLADKLDLIALKKSIIKEVKTNADLEQLVGSHDVSVFKPSTVELIARKSLEINRGQPPVITIT
ncbi:hypothetical protein B9Z55_007869 [Caenorhabditis nigoni]|uniref:BTB domain-containing protein n=1 Tax=Caenorhabditis nigoni TaxID=1611254 RepID=A0A2G5VBY5_9PELO|nr:hypothetical protein B9Z55_007869 [Caenorhabditis nigoni]